jgi:hypothetical protein
VARGRGRSRANVASGSRKRKEKHAESSERGIALNQKRRTGRILRFPEFPSRIKRQRSDSDLLSNFIVHRERERAVQLIASSVSSQRLLSVHRCNPRNRVSLFLKPERIRETPSSRTHSCVGMCPKDASTGEFDRP